MQGCHIKRCSPVFYASFGKMKIITKCVDKTRIGAKMKKLFKLHFRVCVLPIERIIRGIYEWQNHSTKQSIIWKCSPLWSLCPGSK